MSKDSRKLPKAIVVAKHCIVSATLLLVIGSALAQWVDAGDNSYTFNSTSTTTSVNNSTTVNNSTSGVNNLTATISSSDGSTSAGVFSSLSRAAQSASMFGFTGQGAASNTAGAPGPNITLNNSSSINFSINGYITYTPPQSGWGYTNPTYSSGSSAVINVMSNGTSSTVSQYGTSSSDRPPFPLVSSDYNGANGGNVVVNVTSSPSAQTVLTLTGPSSGQIINPNYPYSAFPWQPAAAVINAQSNGGTASALISAPDAANRQGYGIGSGGNGGNVTVQTATNTTLQIGQIGAPVVGYVAGISAVSYGGLGAFCCSPPGNTGIYPYQYQQTLQNGPFNDGNVSVLNSGANGNGGNVTVVNNALITAENNVLPSYLGGQYASGVIGIVAASIGASMQINPSNFITPDSSWTSYGVTTPSGLGGVVNVTNNSNINIPGASSIGILALSSADALIGPPTLSTSGAGGSAGAVTINNTGTIAIGSGNNPTTVNGTISAGIVGVSSIGWLFQPFNTGSYAQMSAGNGGDVQITNSGSVASNGATSLGLVALSIGNSGLLVNNGNSTSNTYVGSAVTQNGANSNAGSATVSNSGSVITVGESSVGILAAANGSGGLFNNNINPIYGTPVVNKTTQIQTAPLTSGVYMGSQENSYTADGGAVSVTNTGTVVTGINGGGGEASIGIVAQSVGGGGGSYAGTSGLAWVGDAGGLGGDGGTVSVQNLSSGSVTTVNDGSIGILAQSIGGGGGNGAGASGLFAAVGGSGGGGGNGGTVSVSNGVAGNSVPSIVTSGDYSAGIVAQSVGGGGGNGGYSKSYGVFVSTGIGGAGGDGGSGGTVNFTNYGTIQSSGDQSQGVLLQSIGGGGGIGGAAASYSVGGVFASAIAVGGTGGSGGNGGNIGTSTNPAINSGTISTTGNDAMGVLAQSIGGGGGNGGSTLAKSIAASPDPEVPAIAFTASIGGSGGTTGNGGSVYFQNNGTITTNGINSHGISVHSIGGGGGNGGDASNAGASTIGIPEVSVELGLGVGGSGSAAGNGGTASVINTLNSSITTYGHNATGIFAQSIGGGGGISGVGNSNQPGGAGGEITITPAIAVGGNGGAGGLGGSVNVTNAGSMATYGTASSAITAQSIGGGGGFGGNAGVLGTSGSAAVSIAVGGNGGAGGNAGAVTVANSGNISTGASVLFTGYNSVALGGDSHGIVAQSISGGGGIGGSADPTANMISSYLEVAMKGVDAILTWKNIYKYFFASSGIPPLSYTANVGVGGSGGNGGTAGVVDVTNSGTIQTIGHRSFGILAQSIGGGGGTGGSVMSGSSAVGTSLSGGIGLAALKGLTFEAGVNVGGSGGTSSAGNTVNITQSGSIVTSGYGSHGVVAQSIGGGGGVGADGSIAANTGFTGSASVNHGLSGGFNIALGSTNLEPAIGSGGAVNYTSSSSNNNGVNTSPSITTNGDNAVGILAQSIGGGGGLGSGGCTNNGMSANASACFTNTAMTSGTSTPISFINGGQSMSFSINPYSSSSSTPSNGGAVNINSTDSINVNGSGSIGILAQSIGGGGGLILGNSANIQSVTLPTMGIGNGAGGSVNVTANNINLNASAVGSIGVLAQSIGGGGGFLGDPNMLLSNSLPSYGAGMVNNPSNTNSSGGAVVVNTPKGSNIQIYGANQIGIFAQSIGAGGGVASINGTVNTQGAPSAAATQYGTGGTVNINVQGNIIDNGQQGGTVGIFAQSQGNATAQGAQNIVITLGQSSNTNTQNIIGYVQANTGIIVSGGSNGSNGTNEVILNVGSRLIVPQGNNAIVSIDGTTNVTNSGTIAGNVNLVPAANSNAKAGSITNTTSGIYIPAGAVIVSNNSLKNYGKVFVDGIGIVGETDIHGSYKQYSTGTTYFDFNTTFGTNDYLKIVADNVSVGTMLQGGRFQMTRVDSNTLPTIGKTALLVTAQGGFLSSADGVDATPISISDTSPLVVWGLQQQANNLLAQYQGTTSNPTGYSFTKNQKKFLDYVVKSYNAGDPGIEKAIGNLVSNGASVDLKNALNTLNGAALTIQQQTVVMTGNSMLGNALSCPTFERNGTIYGETECVWGKYNGGQLRQAYADNNPGYRANDNTFSIGGQYRVASDTFVGASVRFGQTNTSSTNFGATANVGDVSVGIKKLIGDYYLGLSGAFGVSSQSNNRYSTDFFTGQNYNMTSHSNAYYGGIRTRNAYQFNLPGNTYIKPYLDLDGLWIHTPSYQETGAAQVAPLQYSNQNSFNFIASPMVEIGGRIDLSAKKESWIRPFISAGAMFITNNTTNIAASIVGANSGTYQISAQAPSALFSTNAGIQVFSGEKVDVKLEYSAQAGQGFVGQSGTAKMNYRF